MAEENNLIQFYRGNKPESLEGLKPNAIYFFSDTCEIYTGGKTYGMSGEQSAFFVEEIAKLEGEITALDHISDEVVKIILGVIDPNDPDAQLAALKGYTQDSLVGRLDTAEENIQEHTEALQGLAQDLADLDAYVGDIPTGYEEQETIIAYINKKAEETLAAANGGSSESAASVKAALDTHKAENDASFQDVNESIQAVGEFAQKVRQDLDAFLDDADTSEKAIDTLKEIQEYITSDGAAAENVIAKIAAAQKAGDDAQAAAELAQETADEAAEAAAAAAEVAAQGVADAAKAQAAAEAADAKAVAADGKAVAADAKADAAQTYAEGVAADVATKASQEALDAAVGDIAENLAAIQELQGTSHSHENKDYLDNVDQHIATAKAEAEAFAQGLLTWNAI